MSIIKTHEIKCDYTIIKTGYTSRLIETFSDPENRTLYSEITVVCILDVLCGKKNKNAWASWSPHEESVKLKSMLTTFDLDGVIVFKMGESKKSPFYASSYFHEEYGSDTKNRYCASFDGIMDAMSIFEHKGLGKIVYMAFGAQSG